MPENPDEKSFTCHYKFPKPVAQGSPIRRGHSPDWFGVDVFRTVIYRRLDRRNNGIGLSLVENP